MLTFGLAGLAAITLGHPSATRMHTWPWTLLTALIWLLPVAWQLARTVTQPPLRLPARIVTVALALLALTTVLSAWLSPFRNLSLARCWPTLGGVAFFLLLHDWLAGGNAARQRLSAFIAVAGAALVTTSLVAWAWVNWPTPWATRNTIPFGHSNYTAGMAVLLLPWFALRCFEARGFARLGWTAVIAGTLLLIVSTSSRGAALALAGVIGAGTLVALIAGPWSRGRKLLLLLGALVVATVSILANPRLRDSLRQGGWSASASESNRQRSAMLEAAARLGAERPLLGWGPGSVPLAYPRVRAQLDGGVENVLQVHNTPLQLWATIGIGGILAGGLLLLALFAALRHALSDPSNAGPVIAATGSLAGYGIFALTDHQLDLPVIVALTGAALALVMAAAGSRGATIGAPGRHLFGSVFAMLVLAGPAWALGRDLLARRALFDATEASARGDDASALAALDRATAWVAADPFFQHQASALLLRRAEAEPEATRRARITRDAALRLEASLAADVHAEYAHFNLGWIHLELGQPAIAARHFTAAARLSPDKGGVYFGLALALQAEGRADAAVRAFALEGINDPRSITSPAWEIPALRAIQPAVQAEMRRLYARLADGAPDSASKNAGRARPAWDRAAQIRAAATWTGWWLGDARAPHGTERAFNGEMVALALALPTIGANGPLPPAAPRPPWARLYAAWRARKFEDITSDREYAAALARRAARHGDDFAAFLRADTGEDAALVRIQRRQRIGYGVLALHPDAPVLTDLYVVQENRLVADFAANLFPPKGWLPGHLLLASLPSTEPAPDAR